MRRILWSLLGLFLLLCAAVTVLLTTQWGAQFVLARVGGLMAGRLSYASVQGSLSGHLHIHGLDYRTTARDTRIDDLDLNWSPPALFGGTLDIEHLHLTGMHVTTLQPSAGTSAGLPQLQLPLNLKVRDLSVQDVTVQRPGAAPLHINKIRLSGSADRRGIHFTYLDIDTPWIKVHMSGTVQPRGDYPLKVEAHWISAAPQIKAVTGALHVHGSLKSLYLSQHVAAPVDADITAHVTDVLGSPQWQGHVVIHDLDAPALGLKLPVSRLTADLTAGGGLHAFASQGRVTVAAPALPKPVTVHYAIAYNDQVLHIASVTATLPGVPTRLYLKGTVSRGQTYTVDLSAGWDELVWPLAAAGPYTLTSAHGAAQLQGSLDDYRLSFQAPFDGRSLPPSQWQLRGHGGRHALNLSTVEVHTLDGLITAQGTLGWSPELRWDLHLKGGNLDPAVQWPSYPGKLRFTAATAGTYTARKTTVALQVPSAGGQLRGQPFSAGAALDYADKRLRIDHLKVTAGKDYVTASGTAGAQWDMSWTLKAPDLGTVMPKAKGVLDSSGRITGPLHRPKVDASIQARGLAYATYSLGRLDAKAALDMRPGRRSDISVAIDDLEAAGRHLDRADLHGTGTLDAHRVYVTARSGAALLDVRLRGGYRDRQWTGTLSRLSLTHGRSGDWQLAQPVPITLAMDHAALQRLCWVRDPAAVCVQAHWRKGGPWDAQLRARRIQLAWLGGLMASQTQLTGAMEVSLDAVYRDTLDLHGRVDVSGATAAVTLPDQTRASLKIATGTLVTQTRDGVIVSRLAVVLGNGDGLHATVTVPVPPINPGTGPRAPIPLSGTITARWTRFDLLPHFMPTVSKPKGVLTAKLDLSGTLSQPRATGSVDIAQGAVDVPAYGLTLTQLKIHAASSDGQTFALSGSAVSGGGTAHFHANGTLPLGSGPQDITLTLTTERFQAVNMPEAQALLTADITVHVTRTTIDFTGNVFIPEAKLQPPDLSTSVKTSSDVVIVGGGATPRRAAGRALSGIIEIRFGDKVQFEGYGLKAKITGDIAVQEQPKGPILGYGSLNVTGVFKAYGQNLTITQGRISYVGSPIDNPGVAIRAIRKINNDITVGITATGTVRQPRFTIFSEPAMDQTDALSYLLLGHPVNQASTQQGKELASAALSLGLTGGEFLAKKLGRMFGIEQVEVNTNPETGNPALILGTYLRPDLFVSYGFDIIQHLNILRMQYQISKQWALDAQSGLYTGADILYTIETH